MADRRGKYIDRSSKKSKEKVKKRRHKDIKEEKRHHSREKHRDTHKKRQRDYNSDSGSNGKTGDHHRHKHIREERSVSPIAERKKIKREKDDPPKEQTRKIEPNMELSGKLAEDTNTFNGVVIKYNEPEEARKPKRRWRLYPFKGDQTLPFIPIHRQSAYLLGRSRMIADIPIDHPSCSKQHAVLQFRLVDFEREDGTTGKRVRPYIIDLESANGTFVNNKKIEARRYTELMEKDVVKFGYSSREYVIIHEETKGEEDEEEIE